MKVSLSDFGTDPPSCPKQLSFLNCPSVVIEYSVLGFLCLVFALLIFFRYNSLTIQKKTYRDSLISNTWWISFFLINTFRDVFLCVRYALSPSQIQNVDQYLEFFDCVMGVFCGFILIMALNFQLRYRILAQPQRLQYVKKNYDTSKEFNPETPNASTPESRRSSKNTEVAKEKTQKMMVTVIPRNQCGHSRLKLYELSFSLLFLTTFSFFIAFVLSGNEVVQYVFVGFYASQQLVILILVLMVLMCCNSSSDGPYFKYRVILLVGCIFNLSNVLPLNLWSVVLSESGCVFKIASWVDLFVLADFVALILFFVFIRMEYIRNTEICKWRAIQNNNIDFNVQDFGRD